MARSGQHTAPLVRRHMGSIPRVSTSFCFGRDLLDDSTYLKKGHLRVLDGVLARVGVSWTGHCGLFRQS